MKKTLVIFDCDGTLVDTDWLSAQAFSESLAHFGLAYTPEAILHEFLGIANTVIMKTLNERHKTALTLEAVNKFYTVAMSRGIQAGAMRVLPESLGFVKDLAASGDFVLCVGSNGNKDVVIEELEVGGYIGAIARPDIFAASDVGKPKPFPDLFLHIARIKGFDPAGVLVVDDSATGARAGVAAGMKTIGYLGLAHDYEGQKKALLAEGVEGIIDTLGDLRRYV